MKARRGAFFFHRLDLILGATRKDHPASREFTGAERSGFSNEAIFLPRGSSLSKTQKVFTQPGGWLGVYWSFWIAVYFDSQLG
ncbi:MAG: hypothetical protein AUG75_12780 [Cyanobacteria bacterium 13_1_20CM_4_61_6]|nr:MAG: hypothetical protein AUG75_12780 [Cyanobacteria bacterium 13_1_20CM_4_61_6]